MANFISVLQSVHSLVTKVILHVGEHFSVLVQISSLFCVVEKFLGVVSYETKGDDKGVCIGAEYAPMGVCQSVSLSFGDLDLFARTICTSLWLTPSM